MGEEDHARFFDPVQRLQTVREELGEGVWAGASKFRSLPGVTGAVAGEGSHLHRPEKCDPASEYARMGHQIPVARPAIPILRKKRDRKVDLAQDEEPPLFSVLLANQLPRIS